MKPTTYLISLTCAALAASAPNIHPYQNNDRSSTVNLDSENFVIATPNGMSGNTLQVPVHIPINVCGNSVSIVGLLNPAFGNTCVNDQRRDIGRTVLEKCYFEVDYDEECQTYTFKVPEGVVVDVCGCQVGPGRVKREEKITCGKDDCVTIG